MKEYQLKWRARDYFEKQGYYVWFPPKVKWIKEQDIFGIWDGIAWRDNEFIFFQLTTIKNKSTRRKKIVNYMLPKKLYFTPPVQGWLMCWRKREKKFEIFKI